jgi:hypothetical protein
MQNAANRNQKKPSRIELSAKVGAEVAGGGVALAVFPLSLISHGLGHLGTGAVWLSRQLIALTGGGEAYINGRETVNEKFLHSLILLGFWNSAKQWALAVELSDWGRGFNPLVWAVAGLTFSLFTQVVQSRFLRADNPTAKKKEADKLAQFDRMADDAMEGKINIAKRAGKAYNNAGIKTARLLGAVVIATWTFEVHVMGVGAQWPNPALSLAGLALLCFNIIQAFLVEGLIKLEEEQGFKNIGFNRA